MKNTITFIAVIAFLAGPLSQAVELSEKDSGKIARVVGFLLSNTHFKRMRRWTTIFLGRF